MPIYQELKKSNSVASETSFHLINYQEFTHVHETLRNMGHAYRAILDLKGSKAVKQIIKKCVIYFKIDRTLYKSHSPPDLPSELVSDDPSSRLRK